MQTTIGGLGLLLWYYIRVMSCNNTVGNNPYFVSDCLFGVHQSWGESRENLVSHILWRVAAASDS